MTTQDQYLPPISRDTDPDTSRDAAQLVTNRYSLVQQVTDYVTDHPGHTRGEIADGMRLEQPRVWRRISDAVNTGRIRYGEPRLYAGRKQQTLWPSQP